MGHLQFHKPLPLSLYDWISAKDDGSTVTVVPPLLYCGWKKESSTLSTEGPVVAVAGQMSATTSRQSCHRDFADIVTSLLRHGVNGSDCWPRQSCHELRPPTLVTADQWRLTSSTSDACVLGSPLNIDSPSTLATYLRSLISLSAAEQVWNHFLCLK